MRRSRRVDWLLLATLLPTYLVIQAVVVHRVLATGTKWTPFDLTGAQASSGYPVVVLVQLPDQPIRVGDRVLRFADIDLQGLSQNEVWHATTQIVKDGQPFQIEAERDGERLELMVTPISYPYWLWKVPVSLSLALAATFLLLRAPYWHLARRFFAATLSWCVLRAAESGEPTIALAQLAARPFAAGLLLWCFFEWTEAARPLATWQRVLPWAIGLIALVVSAVSQLLVLPTWPWLGWVGGITGIVFYAAGLLGLARAYGRAGAREKRQLRWVLSGLLVGLLPLLFNIGVRGLVLNLALTEVVTGLCTVAVPLGIAVSIVGYQYLDIDRLISASAAATLVGIALLGGGLAVVPPIARTASAALGFDPEIGQLALSMGLAAVLVPAYRWLRPWLDQRMFPERHEITLRFEQLRSELAACRGADELTQRTGEGIDGLALLAALAERSSEVIARLDADEVTRQAQAMQAALRRYVPGAVAERVLAGDALEPAECEVTVLFVDIRGYTSAAERLQAKDVFATLNEHTERVSRIVQESGGTIVEFNGDGMMAVFGAPGALAKKEQHAVEAARKVVESMPPHLAVGVGVATGPAFVGNIRSTDRMIWSAVGSTTNLAARLQSLTRDLRASISLDEATREGAGYMCSDFVRHENLAIRGRTGRFDVFALPLG